jgi:hypothetical protein
MKIQNKVEVFSPADGFNRNHRKEKHFQREYCIIEGIGQKTKTPITLRIYGTNAANYCCLWIYGEFNYEGMKHQLSFQGSGMANGYGYHRPSEAAQLAIESAGIRLKNHIGGRGDDAISDALYAIADYLGIKNPYLHTANP